MALKMTIKQALQLWEDEQKKLFTNTNSHPPPDWIQKFAHGKNVPDKNRWINHLADCHHCREIWLNHINTNHEIDQYADVVLLKVASDKNSFSDITRVYTESGRYLITFRKNLEEQDSCLVTLNVLMETDVLENKKIVVRDKNHTILLSAQISQGEASGWINNINKLDISSISVIVEE